LRPIGRDISLEGRAGHRPPTVTSAAPRQFLILLVASWIGRRQGEAIEYLRAGNGVLRARFGHKRLRFGDGERRLLAQKGKPVGRKLLAEMASLATPETNPSVVPRPGRCEVRRKSYPRRYGPSSHSR